MKDFYVQIFPFWPLSASKLLWYQNNFKRKNRDGPESLPGDPKWSKYKYKYKIFIGTKHKCVSRPNMQW